MHEEGRYHRFLSRTQPNYDPPLREPGKGTDQTYQSLYCEYPIRLIPQHLIPQNGKMFNEDLGKIWICSKNINHVYAITEKEESWIRKKNIMKSFGILFGMIFMTTLFFGQEMDNNKECQRMLLFVSQELKMKNYAIIHTKMNLKRKPKLNV